MSFIYIAMILFALTYNAGITNEVGRIGIKDVPKTGKIVKVCRNSPADKAGLKVGDVIISADGVSGPDRQIKGEVGTEVTLVIRRKKEVFTVTVLRVSESTIEE